MTRNGNHFEFNKRTSRLLSVAAALVLLSAALARHPYETLASPPQGDDGTVTHSVNGNTDNWRVEQPNVRQGLTPYKQIMFRAGDRVTVSAGGCVQTGGHGSTWKRYVNPSANDSPNKYHGLIWIPRVIGGPAATGVPPTPVRLLAVNNQTFNVPAGLDPAQEYLRLGYEDSDYSDNGYADRDNGTDDQCKGIRNAFVAITIVHGQPTAQPTPTPAPFDLIWDGSAPANVPLSGVDDNGIPLDAQWGWQLTHPLANPFIGGAPPDPTLCNNGPFASPCTSWPTTQDTAVICSAEQLKGNPPPLYGVAGHANFNAGTYDGLITWETHSASLEDDDYNFDMIPKVGAGLTAVRPNMEIEFDSDETIDHFTTPWWNAFHKGVDSADDDDDAVRRNFFRDVDGTSGRYAIVTGLIGLDCAHDCHTELHPVWAMAIRVKDDDPNDEVWAMFVRRWGDEGFCSGNQHYLEGLPQDIYTFRLPWRPGASAVNVGPDTIFKARDAGTAVGYQWAPNEGVLVSFTVTAPQSGTGNRVNGEIHLRWTGGSGPAPIPGANGSIPGSVPLARRGPVFRTIPGVEPEARLTALVKAMTPASRNAFRALLPEPAVTFDGQTIRQGVAVRLPSLPRRVTRARRPQYRSVPDPEKREQNQRILDGLHQALSTTTVR